MSTKALQILVIEVYDSLRESVVAALHAKGHATRGQAHAHLALADISRQPTDIVVLAAIGGESLELLKTLRSAFPEIGILVVSPSCRSSDKANCYSNGADIYLVKPASTEELGAAVAAIARRLRPHRPLHHHVEASLNGSCVLHKLTLQLIGPSGLIHVSDIEQQILSAFAQAPSHRIEHAQMFEICGKKGVEPSKAAIEVQIARLRKKLESAGASAPTIKSIRGIGYQLCVPLTVQPVYSAAALHFSQSKHRP